MVSQPRQVRMMHNLVRMQQQIAHNQMAMMTVQQRNFGGKRKKKNQQDDASETEPEVVEETPVEAVEETVEATPEPEPVPEPVPEPEPVQEAPDFSAASEPQPAQEVAADLFGGFSVGGVKVVNSAPGNKPPIAEDTIEGRYAGVLFTSASE